MLEESIDESSEWFLIDFADPETNELLGSVIVRALTPLVAVAKTWELGINPGGNVAILDIAEDKLPSTEWHDKLLSHDDLRNLHLCKC